MTVYKLVRRRKDRRLSAILPDHLAETYRIGRKSVVVGKSLAFDNLKDARKWRMRWLKKGVPLELWTAEAKEVKTPHAIMTLFLGRGWSSRWTIKELTPEVLTKEVWLGMLQQVEARGQNYFSHGETPNGDPIEALPWNVAPDGSVLCTNLTLKRRLLW